MLGGRATMTSIEDWSLQLYPLRFFGSKPSCNCDLGTRNCFGGRPSWKATGPTGLQLRSGNSRFGGGPSWKATRLQLQSANLWFLGGRRRRQLQLLSGNQSFGWQAQLENGLQLQSGYSRFSLVAGLAQFDCNVRPEFSWRRALENSWQWPCPPCCPASQCMWRCWDGVACFLGLGLSAVCTLWNEWALLHVYFL